MIWPIRQIIDATTAQHIPTKSRIFKIIETTIIKTIKDKIRFI